MKQSPSWEGNSSSLTQEILLTLISDTGNLCFGSCVTNKNVCYKSRIVLAAVSPLHQLPETQLPFSGSSGHCEGPSLRPVDSYPARVCACICVCMCVIKGNNNRGSRKEIFPVKVVGIK
jgi:hypothetical protein